MRAKHKADIPLPAPVLRGIVMHAQPHALVRPGRPGAAGLAAKVHALSPALRADVAQEPEVVRKTPTYEGAFAEGRAEGYAAGRFDAEAESKNAVRAALDEARALAVEDGRQQGLADGRRQAQAEAERMQAELAQQAAAALQQRLERVDALLEELQAEAARRLLDAEDDLVALGHEALCRMLGKGAATPAALRSMVKHLLAQHGQRAQLAVHVHPDDLELLASEGADGAGTWRWIADNDVQLGGVILRSPEGSLDARLETQLAALRDALLAVRRDRRTAASANEPVEQK